MIHAIAAATMVFVALLVFGANIGPAFLVGAGCFAGWAAIEAFIVFRSKPPSQ